MDLSGDLEPTSLVRTSARKRVQVCGFPDGRIKVRHCGLIRRCRVHNKMQRANQTEIVDSKRPRAACAMAQALLSAHPRRQRNTDAPVRRSRRR